MDRLSARIAARQAQLAESGLLRQRNCLAKVCHADSVAPLLDFASNDYLGLSQSTVLKDAAAAGAVTYGVGSGASPLVTGYQQPHVALEQLLCEQTGQEAALLFCSGFSANQALMKTLFNDGDTVIADKLIHASVIDGIADSGARLKRFVHSDVESATRILVQSEAVALITESVFSMDGDVAPLQDLAEQAHQHHAWFIVDDAHGFGVIGDNGLGGASICRDIDVQVVTFGKALGCQGAAILASQACIDFLVANARHYIYSTALSPVSAYIALTAVQSVLNDTSLKSRLQQNIGYFKNRCKQQAIELMPSITPIQPVVIGNSQVVLEIAKALKNKNILVGAIRSPTVPKGAERLRITLSASQSQQDIDTLIEALVPLLKHSKNSKRLMDQGMNKERMNAR